MKTTAKSLVMKPMFRSKVEIDKKKESKYNPSYDVSDYEDVAWKEYLLYQQEYKKKCKDFLIRDGIVDENGELTEEYK